MRPLQRAIPRKLALQAVFAPYKSLPAGTSSAASTRPRPALSGRDCKYLQRLGELRMRRFDQCVTLALEKYNEAYRNRNGCDYVLVEKTALSKFFLGGTIHVNFLAKPSNAPPDAKPKLFFAEGRVGPKSPSEEDNPISRITRCCILSGKNRPGGYCAPCSYFCWVGKVKHPRGGGYCKGYGFRGC